MRKNTDTNIDVIENKIRPLKDEKGNIIDDYELCVEALNKIDKYQETNKKPAPVPPKFIQWLRNGVEFVKQGKGTMVDYKQANVLKELDYDLICANTDAQNAKLEKQGVFKSKVMKTIKGVAK